MAMEIPAGFTISLANTLGAAFFGHFVTAMCVLYTVLNTARVFITLTSYKVYTASPLSRQTSTTATKSRTQVSSVTL